MLFAILIHGSEASYEALTEEEESALLTRHGRLREELSAQARLGPVMRLQADGARTVRRYKDRVYVTDGPFAETKEQLMGIYVVECATLDEACEAADRLNFETAVFEVRPLTSFDPGQIAPRHGPGHLGGQPAA